MATNNYPIGDGFRLEARFKVDGVLTDPSTVTFQLKDPDDIITTYVYGTDAELVKTGVGIYYMDITVTKPLKWWYRIVGTGTVIAAMEHPFVGIQSQFS
jgi:hypothetical protein